MLCKNSLNLQEITYDEVGLYFLVKLQFYKTAIAKLSQVFLIEFCDQS